MDMWISSGTHFCIVLHITIILKCNCIVPKTLSDTSLSLISSKKGKER